MQKIVTLSDIINRTMARGGSILEPEYQCVQAADAVIDAARRWRCENTLEALYVLHATVAAYDAQVELL